MIQEKDHDDAKEDRLARGLARLEAQSFSHDLFLPENSLLDNLDRIRRGNRAVKRYSLTLDEGSDHVTLDRLYDGIDTDRPDQHRGTERHSDQAYGNGRQNWAQIWHEIRRTGLRTEKKWARKSQQIERKPNARCHKYDSDELPD